jgi:hypothetical protein
MRPRPLVGGLGDANGPGPGTLLAARSITLMGTAAVVLSATTLLAVPASAERICRQVCDGDVNDLAHMLLHGGEYW